MGKQYGFYMDSSRCIKCWACEVACKQWNNIKAKTVSRRKVVEIEEGEFPNVTRTYMSQSCRHCADPACVKACPANAISKRQVDGIVVVDKAKCINCFQCLKACPFDIPEFTEAGMDKCDACLSIGVNISEGEMPHCVITCPTQALQFGVIDELPCSNSVDAMSGGAVSSDPLQVDVVSADVLSGDSLSVDALEHRMQAYKLFASLFLKEPTSDLLFAMKSNYDCKDKLGAWLSDISDGNVEDKRKDAAADFASMFLNMSFDPVSTYESVYVDSDHLLMQDARDEVVATYGEAGFIVGDDFNLPEDHISAELEFMSKLSVEELNAVMQGDLTGVQKTRCLQRAFFSDHLNVWIPKFCDDVINRANTDFYIGIAELLVDFLVEESNIFA